MSEKATREFLARLWELQAKRGLTDAQLARLIGWSHPYLSRLKRGVRQNPKLGLRIVLSAVREFPELGLFLTTDLPTSQPILPICKSEVA